MPPPERLFAYLGTRLVGWFDRTGEELARLTYADQPGTIPLSLSLPIGQVDNESAAFFYLDNLLPDEDETRARWAVARGVDADTFALLSQVGEDVAGAVTLSTEPDLPAREPVPLVEATADDIAYRIATLRRDPSSPPPAETNPRWSLGGQQAKFSLALVGGEWFWSTYEVPSTHIFKPALTRHRDVDLAEQACLNLASEAGVLASRAELMEFKGQRVIAVQRWDRADGHRLHAEDINQSLGRPSWEKYEVSAADVVEVLRPYDQEWPFVRQLAFNLAVGNSDAHAKNYSILLAEGGQVRLAPLYDCLPIFLWPQYNQLAAMPVGGARRPAELTEAAWIRFAHQTSLPAEQVLAEVRPIIGHVKERLPEVCQEVGLSNQAVDKAVGHVRQLPA